jgi:hypothetical protein
VPFFPVHPGPVPGWRQFPVVPRLQPATNLRTTEYSHASLNFARNISRARANLDLTVPRGTPIEKAISS